MSEQKELAFEVAEHREQQREALVYKVLRNTMAAIAERGLRYVALLATIAIFCYAAFDPLLGRTVVGGLMAVVYIITLFKKGGGDGD